MGRGIIDVPLRDLAEFLKKIENNMSWDNYLVVSVISHHYCEFPTNFFIRKQEM